MGEQRSETHAGQVLLVVGGTGAIGAAVGMAFARGGDR
jgi:NAD(P)-dependent dehydrogenase (short-subunit alcohol dehydrogenase family)